MSVESLTQPSGPEIILPEECLTLPFVCQEGVKDVLKRLEEMEREKRWLKVRTPEELIPLIPQAQEHAQSIFDKLRPRKNAADASWETTLDTARGAAWNATRSTARHTARHTVRNAVRNAAWNAARDVVQGATFGVARDVARSAAWNAARDVARNAAWNAAWDAARDVARGAAIWEVVKDLPGFEKNPFLCFLSLYELGAAEIKFRQVKETPENENPEEMLIVHFPIKLEDGRLALACLVFPDNCQGDETVQYFHPWKASCSEITLLNPPPRREIK